MARPHPDPLCLLRMAGLQEAVSTTAGLWWGLHTLAPEDGWASRRGGGGTWSSSRLVEGPLPSLSLSCEDGLSEGNETCTDGKGHKAMSVMELKEEHGGLIKTIPAVMHTHDLCSLMKGIQMHADTKTMVLIGFSNS